jgi:glycerate 2-kinase
MRAAGADARAALDANDAHRALAVAGDLLVSGPTRTNLLDLYLVLHGHCSLDERTDLTS